MDLRAKFSRLFKATFCQHEFRLDDLKRTGIPIPPKPAEGASWKECQKWADEVILGNHPSHTHRISWGCCKCGRVYYAHCGLDILRDHGRIAPPK